MTGPQWYILVDREPIPVADREWYLWRSEDFARCIVAKTKIDDAVEVSTVFLGLDHNYGDGPPILFETMIFGGPHDHWQDRYHTWTQAVAGHDQVVAALCAGKAPE